MFKRISTCKHTGGSRQATADCRNSLMTCADGRAVSVKGRDKIKRTSQRLSGGWLIMLGRCDFSHSESCVLTSSSQARLLPNTLVSTAFSGWLIMLEEVASFIPRAVFSLVPSRPIAKQTSFNSFLRADSSCSKRWLLSLQELCFN